MKITLKEIKERSEKHCPNYKFEINILEIFLKSGGDQGALSVGSNVGSLLSALDDRKMLQNVSRYSSGSLSGVPVVSDLDRDQIPAMAETFFGSMG